MTHFKNNSTIDQYLNQFQRYDFYLRDQSVSWDGTTGTLLASSSEQALNQANDRIKRSLDTINTYLPESSKIEMDLDNEAVYVELRGPVMTEKQLMGEIYLYANQINELAEGMVNEQELTTERITRCYAACEPLFQMLKTLAGVTSGKVNTYVFNTEGQEVTVRKDDEDYIVIRSTHPSWEVGEKGKIDSIAEKYMLYTKDATSSTAVNGE